MSWHERECRRPDAVVPAVMSLYRTDICRFGEMGALGYELDTSWSQNTGKLALQVAFASLQDDAISEIVRNPARAMMWCSPGQAGAGKRPSFFKTDSPRA